MSAGVGRASGRIRSAGFRAAQRAVAGLGQIVGQVGNEDLRHRFSLWGQHLTLKGQRMFLPRAVLADIAIGANPRFLAGTADFIRPWLGLAVVRVASTVK